MNLLLSLLTILLLPTTAFGAEAFTIYQCDFKTSPGQFLSERVTVFVSEDSEKTFAIDGMIHYMEGKPIEAKLSMSFLLLTLTYL